MRGKGPQDHLDALIARTARAMTDVAPPVSLRGAVRRRLEPRGSEAWRVRPWQAGLAAAAMVVLAFIAGRVLTPAPVVPDVRPPGAARLEAPVVPPSIVAAVDPPTIRVGPVQPAAGPSPGADARPAVPLPLSIELLDAGMEPLDVPPMHLSFVTVEAMAPPAPLDLGPPVEEPAPFMELLEPLVPLQADLLEIEPLVLE